MGLITGISWCHHTFNPWWGCVRVSEACRNCYAEATDARFIGDNSAMGPVSHWGPNAPRRFFSDSHWNEPIKWNRAAEKAGERRRVFCASMADVFEDRQDLDEHRRRLWALIAATPWLDWLLLTKRPESWAAAPLRLSMLPWVAVPGPAWPNVWLGVTAEDNERSAERIIPLRRTPAVVRFVSCEPILERITPETWDLVLGPESGLLGPVSWLIVGDESGAGARPAEAEWVRVARDAAQRHAVAFHFKQWAGKAVPAGIRPPRGWKGGKIHLPVLDGRAWAEFPR